jgi:hypothetical protein
METEDDETPDYPDYQFHLMHLHRPSGQVRRWRSSGVWERLVEYADEGGFRRCWVEEEGRPATKPNVRR